MATEGVSKENNTMRYLYGVNDPINRMLITVLANCLCVLFSSDKRIEYSAHWILPSGGEDDVFETHPKFDLKNR
jgi:hypothetical protein